MRHRGRRAQRRTATVKTSAPARKIGARANVGTPLPLLPATAVCGRLRTLPGANQGKDERGVGYVKRNAIAGRSFATWAALEAHLAWWMREVADRRIHGTTGEPSISHVVTIRGATLASSSVL